MRYSALGGAGDFPTGSLTAPVPGSILNTETCPEVGMNTPLLPMPQSINAVKLASPQLPALSVATMVPLAFPGVVNRFLTTCSGTLTT
jgi:hypothetical protein